MNNLWHFSSSWLLFQAGGGGMLCALLTAALRLGVQLQSVLVPQRAGNGAFPSR